MLRCDEERVAARAEPMGPMVYAVFFSHHHDLSYPWRIHGAGIYANIKGVLMVNVTIFFCIHGSYGVLNITINGEMTCSLVNQRSKWSTAWLWEINELAMSHGFLEANCLPGPGWVGWLGPSRCLQLKHRKWPLVQIHPWDKFRVKFQAINETKPSLNLRFFLSQ